jgi:hypothetical protein
MVYGISDVSKLVELYFWIWPQTLNMHKRFSPVEAADQNLLIVFNKYVKSAKWNKLQAKRNL